MADQRTPSIAEQVIGIRQSNATQYNEALRTAFAGVQTNVAILGTALQMKEQGEMSKYRQMHLDRMDEANGAMRDLSESHRSLEEYLKTGGTVPDGIGNNSGKDVGPNPSAPTVSTSEGWPPPASKPSDAAQNGSPFDMSSIKIPKGLFDRRTRKHFDWFINKGLTPEVAAGVVANMYRESGGDPKAIGDRHLGEDGQANGLFQWREERWARYLDWIQKGAERIAEKGGYKVTKSMIDGMVYSPDNQRNFFLMEAKSRGHDFGKTVESSNKAMAAFEVYQGYNDPDGKEFNIRLAYARALLKQYNDTEEARKSRIETAASYYGVQNYGN